MLEVGVHHDDRAAGGVAQARAQRGLMAEIAGEGDVADMRVARGGAQRRERAVARAVVDEQDLVAAERGENAGERRAQRRDVAGLVMGRHHNRNFSLRNGHRSKSAGLIGD